MPVGVIDRPFDQRRDPLIADLSGTGGHLGVAGGPQTGKSTLLRTVIAALALTHTPREVQFHCFDFGGGNFNVLSGLPHMGTISSRVHTERVNRTVGELHTLLTRREEQFAEANIDGISDYRRRRAAGEFADDPWGDVFLVVDGWSTLRNDFFDLSQDIAQLGARGLNYGIHLLIASPRWADIQSGLRDQIGSRFELRLGDPVDSVVNMRKAKEVPRIPGRGLTEDTYHFLTALPRADGDGDPADSPTAPRNSSGRCATPGATGPAPPPCGCCPTWCRPPNSPRPRDATCRSAWRRTNWPCSGRTSRPTRT